MPLKRCKNQPLPTKRRESGFDGLAHYQREEYEQAAHYYEAALKLSGSRDWRDMLENRAGTQRLRSIAHAGIYYLIARSCLNPQVRRRIRR